MTSRNLDLAIIGNGITASLIHQTGELCWTCWPHFDGDPVFCSLLNQDEEGRAESGYFRIILEDFSHAEQRYDGATAILETCLFSRKGDSVRILDFMPEDKTGIIRLIEPLKGNPRIALDIKPMVDYGERILPAEKQEKGFLFQAGQISYFLSVDKSLDDVSGNTFFMLEKPLSLYFSEEPCTDVTVFCAEERVKTEKIWNNFVQKLTLPSKWQEDVIRAAITLKLCAYQKTGAILPAVTTSIPESQGSGRTWDYRFCWIRDSFYTVHALNGLNHFETTRRYLDFIEEITKDYEQGHIQPLFSIHHATKIEEYFAPHLKGFKGNQPVRIGNAAYYQIQNDAYGSIIMAFEPFFHDAKLSALFPVEKLFEKFELFGEQAYRVWNEPDAGIWEYRGSTSIRTYSAISCWAALDRLARIAESLGFKEKGESWRHRADSIRVEILERSWNEDIQSFAESFGGRFMDASLLLMHVFGFIDPQDERYVKTVRRIGDILKRDNMLYRYVTEDDFGEPETAFTICSFWYVDALYSIGDEKEAEAMFDSLLERRNHVGLFSEDISFRTGNLWGNFPQTYSLVGLIECAKKLSKK